MQSPYAARPTLRSTRNGKVLRGYLTERGVIVGTFRTCPADRYVVTWKSTQAERRFDAFGDCLGQGDKVESIIIATA